MKNKEIEELGKALDEAKHQGMTDTEIVSGLMIGTLLSGFEVVDR